MDESYDETALLRKANDVENIIEDCAIIDTFISEKSGQRYKIVFRKPATLDTCLKNEMFTIFSNSMKTLYENTWGWNELEKRKEIFSPDAKYFLVHSAETNELVGWCMFKFEWDDMDMPEHPVLFCYELHVRTEDRRSSIGKHVMELLLVIAKKYGMWKTMLTCFKINEAAMKFYESIGFGVDVNSPSSCGYTEENYEILSDKPKLR